MRKILFLSLIASALAAGSQAVVFDQVQHSNTVFMAGFNQTDLAQSFIQSSNIISGAGILLRDDVGVGEFGDVTIELWTDLPNASGVKLAEGTALGVTAGMWADVFWADVVIPNTTHYLVFTSTNGNLGVAGDVADPYANGQVYANPGFGGFPTFDYTFHTYTAVPEPASMAALALGAAAMLRRRRKSS